MFFIKVVTFKDGSSLQVQHIFSLRGSGSRIESTILMPGGVIIACSGNGLCFKLFYWFMLSEEIAIVSAENGTQVGSVDVGAPCALVDAAVLAGMIHYISQPIDT